MSAYRDALAAEALKARRAPVLWLCGLGLTILPAFGGLFMYILRDPEQARRMGLLGQKAQLTSGAADWPTLLGIVGQGLAVAGSVLFAFVTAWVFGRESADRTLRTWLASPTPRAAVLAAKGTIVGAWGAAASVWVFALALAVGALSDLPGGSPALIRAAALQIGTIAAMTISLQAVTAFVASAGRGYFPPIGWTFLTLALANILAVLGFGPAFPWTVPALVARPELGPVPVASYALVAATGLFGAWATWRYWERADHTG